MSSIPQSRSGPIRRWAHFAAHHPWQVIGGWVVAIVILGVLAGTVGGELVDKFSVPGAESQKAIDALNSRFPSASGDTAQVVFKTDGNFTKDPASQQPVKDFIAKAQKLPEVLSVSDPFAAQGGTVSPNGQIAYLTIQYDKPAQDIKKSAIDDLKDLVKATSTNGFEAEVGGSVIQELPQTGISELVGIIAAVIVLFIMFGSLIAMGMPIITAGAGVAISTLIVTILAAFLNMSTITTALLSMMGLGVGIDYSLFIITRFREERSHGRRIEESIVTALDTAGRSVLFAGTVVVIALLGLFVIGIPFIGFLGLGAAVAVAMSMLIAIGLMPALLRLLGGPIDRFAFVPNRQRPIANTFGFKWVSRIQKLPAAWLVGALIIIGVLGYWSAFDAQLGSSDAGTNPSGSTTRKAYDLISEGFGPGANGPLLIVIENKNGGKVDQNALNTLATSLGSAKGVVTKPAPVLNPAGDTAIMTVIPTTSPQDAKTENLIKDLRNNVIPPVADASNLNVYVGGSTAVFADLSTATSSRLPVFIALVAGLSIILLMAVFRSVLIPIKAAVANLLSFFAGYGVLVLVFQKGFLGINDWLFGVDRLGPIESFLPVFLFSILFGLSMDYEIFLISRVHEAWGHLRDSNRALREGVGASGRVVLSAGAIMTSVFFAFTLGDQRSIKEIGLGLGAAILIDVLIVRMVVVPSFMTLAGNANWWFPAWLDRILPKLNVEGEPPSAPATHGDGPTPPAVVTRTQPQS